MNYSYITMTPYSLRSIATFLTLAVSALAQTTTPITGNLTVTGSIKAGQGNSSGGVEMRPGGMLIANGILDDSSSLGVLPPPTTPSNSPQMVWYPRKGAFRAGGGGINWSDSNIGYFSTAFGFGSLATKSFSVAMGCNAIASGYWSVAMGANSAATGENSTAFGCYANAFGLESFAAGYWTTASGTNSVALGFITTAVGQCSTALGQETTATSMNSTVIGRVNVGGGNPSVWIPTDPLFEIGNGTPGYDIEDGPHYDAVPSNALTVYKNGDMDVQGVVTCAPGGDIPMFTGN